MQKTTLIRLIDKIEKTVFLQAVLRCLPFMLLSVFLVGSCKTNMSPAAYGSNTTDEAFRLALFPDQILAADDKAYKPAEGYIQTAQSYIAGDINSLKRLGDQEIKHIFGAPSFNWAQDKGELWQYQTEDCVLDVYFFDGQTSSAHTADESRKVSYFEIRNRAHPKADQGISSVIQQFFGGDAETKECLDRISQNG
jgi:hypothetical protein